MAREHYDKLLGSVYGWMVGDFDAKQHAQQQFFEQHQFRPSTTGVAIDLGAGHGLQSVSLARLGFTVKAIDFNDQLLAELQNRTNGLPVQCYNDDLRSLANYATPSPELIVCAGDTLTHLESRSEVQALINSGTRLLTPRGKWFLSFRDYSRPLTGDQRFIPVRSDANGIMTCILDYTDDKVRVTDLLHTRTATGWKQTVSSYEKIRLSMDEVVGYLRESGLRVIYAEPLNGLHTIIANKED